MVKEEPVSLRSGNISAVRTVMTAVEGTIGPKGLDTMLLDPYGEVTITNDGYTILSMMDATHPVTKLLIHAIKSQQEEVGDGTTTAALMACALVLEGYQFLDNGVSVAHLLEGLEEASQRAGEIYREELSFQDKIDYDEKVSYIAGRENQEITDVIVKGLKLVGEKHLQEDEFFLADMVQGVKGSVNTVIEGLILAKEPQLSNGIVRVDQVPVLIIDDAFEIDLRYKELMNTEAGFSHYMEREREFYHLLDHIIASGVKAIFVQRGLDKKAEAYLNTHGIYCLSRVRLKDIARLAEYTGAKALSFGEVEQVDLKSALGFADSVRWDKEKETTEVLGGKGKPMVSIVIGAKTKEILNERVRIAKDAAASVQSALKHGIVAGGGASELYVARRLRYLALEEASLKKVGYDLLAKALEKPFQQMVENAGFHSMEKKALVDQAQLEHQSPMLGLDFKTGQIGDMDALGIYDALDIKLSAVAIAVEVAKSILKINVIIRKKAHQSNEGSENHV